MSSGPDRPDHDRTQSQCQDVDGNFDSDICPVTARGDKALKHL
jgi:hypothetical protein